jgi:hypothetical protein
MARFQIRAAGAAVLALGLAQPLAAQSTGVLAEWYGAGVHAYFDNQLTEAHRALTAAIESGSQDPRAHYYRALTYLRLGRPEQAGADMARGADLEMRDTAGRYPVGRSLERVQGSERMLLERYRVQARTASYQRQQQIRQQRYEEVVRREADVLRRAVNVPLDELASPDVPPLPQPPQLSAQPPAESPEPPRRVMPCRPMIHPNRSSGYRSTPWAACWVASWSRRSQARKEARAVKAERAQSRPAYPSEPDSPTSLSGPNR